MFWFGLPPSRSAHRQHFRRGVRPGWETTGILRHGWNNQDLDGWQLRTTIRGQSGVITWERRRHYRYCSAGITGHLCFERRCHSCGCSSKARSEGHRHKRRAFMKSKILCTALLTLASSMDTTQMYLHANIELKEKALAK